MGTLDLAAIVGRAADIRSLRQRTDIVDPGWTFWELRNLNIHRVVALLETDAAFADVGALGSVVRPAIARHFRRAWWRGLACGVVVGSGGEPWTPAQLSALVDERERRVAIVQWVLSVDAAGGAAVGVHTWLESYLSPVYRAALDGLASSGVRIATGIRERDGLLRLLTDVAELEGASFPAFHGEPSRSAAEPPTAP
jgi:hypothetical protein